MKIYVIGRERHDRKDITLVRAFRTEEAREQWLAKVQCWQAEMTGCEADAISILRQFTKYEVTLV